MKWFYLIIIAMLAGAFAWWFAGDNTASWEGTPLGPAKEFVYAAAEGNYDELPYISTSEAEEEVLAVAERINAEGINPRGIRFKETADMANTFTALVNGKFLTITVTDVREDEWVISFIDFES